MKYGNGLFFETNKIKKVKNFERSFKNSFKIRTKLIFILLINNPDDTVTKQTADSFKNVFHPVSILRVNFS